jgi:hypothetical protein
VPFPLIVGGFDVSSAEGMSFTSNAAGNVTLVALFKPQPSTRWGLDINIENASITDGSTTLARGNAISAADAFLGTAFDAEGTVAVPVGSITLNVWVRIYAAYGIRLVGLCPFVGSCTASSADIDQIILSPPFVGQSGDSVRVGSTRAAVESVYPSFTTTDTDGLLEYTAGSRTFGVAYLQDGECTEIAVSLLLNYPEPA